jgi:lactoylglutathione lyase
MAAARSFLPCYPPYQPGRKTRQTTAASRYQEGSIMQFYFSHNNLNVFDLTKSKEFYQKALGLEVLEERRAADGSFILLFLGDHGTTPHRLELTWLRDRTQPYNLGDNEIHLAFETEDFDAAHQLHQEMGIICFENPKMGIYFIEDPDHYWIEIVPSRKRRSQAGAQ